MKFCKPFGFLALATALLCSACVQSSSVANNDNTATMEHLLGESDNNRAVEIHVGESLRIVLPENATTGYRWEVDRFDRSVIGLIAEEPNYASSRPGSGGRVHFVFEGRSAGAGEISLKEWRSWEGDASVIAKYHLRVKVLP